MSDAWLYWTQLVEEGRARNRSPKSSEHDKEQESGDGPGSERVSAMEEQTEDEEEPKTEHESEADNESEIQAQVTRQLQNELQQYHEDEVAMKAQTPTHFPHTIVEIPAPPAATPRGSAHERAQEYPIDRYDQEGVWSNDWTENVNQREKNPRVESLDWEYSPDRKVPAVIHKQRGSLFKYDSTSDGSTTDDGLPLTRTYATRAQTRR